MKISSLHIYTRLKIHTQNYKSTVNFLYDGERMLSNARRAHR